ncbi:MAG: serine hydrolase [Gaiellaceae bacterium]
MIVAAPPPPLPLPPAFTPPAIEQPASRQVSYGIVSGRAAPGARRVVVTVNGHVLAARSLERRRFSLRVELPVGDQAVRVTTIAESGRRSSAVVKDVFGLPGSAAPLRARVAMNDRVLSGDLRGLVRRHRGTAAVYVESLVDGRGAAWNARARFPAASTLKLAIAATVLAAHPVVPERSSSISRLLRELTTVSDDRAANALLVWLGGSTSAGGRRVDALMRSIGLVDTLMYGGYETRTLSTGIPVRVESQPAFGVGKYTTASDMAALWRALWLASGDRGPLRRAQLGLTPPEARHLLWLAARVRDTPKLDRALRGRPRIAVLHKAGWISSSRHDTGLVFWRGGVFVACVMTWRLGGAGASSDVLAGRVASVSLDHFRRRGR